MRSQTIAAAFASVRVAYENCQQSGNTEWLERWAFRKRKLIEMIPRGSGIDSGPDNIQISQREISFDISFHHMNDNGCYDGWTDHTVRVRPAFDGIDVVISGRDRNEVKDYIHEVYNWHFSQLVEWSEKDQRWLKVEENCKVCGSSAAVCLVLREQEGTHSWRAHKEGTDG